MDGCTITGAKKITISDFRYFPFNFLVYLKLINVAVYCYGNVIRTGRPLLEAFKLQNASPVIFGNKGPKLGIS